MSRAIDIAIDYLLQHTEEGISGEEAAFIEQHRPELRGTYAWLTAEEEYEAEQERAEYEAYRRAQEEKYLSRYCCVVPGGQRDPWRAAEKVREVRATHRATHSIVGPWTSVCLLTPNHPGVHSWGGAA